jgi:hypothetical protein
MDASTVNPPPDSDANRDPGFHPGDEPRRVATFHRDFDLPSTDVEGRGRDTLPPILYHTHRRPVPSRTRFGFDGERFRRPGGDRQAPLEQPLRSGPADTNSSRRPADRRSRRVKASQTYAPSARPWIPVFPRHFVAHFVALSSTPIAATRLSKRSPSTTSAEFALQQSTGRTGKITALVATSSPKRTPTDAGPALRARPSPPASRTRIQCPSIHENPDSICG